ncbi:MAG: hypothetical protein V4773_16325 [Verrucomicrobiota bacterium]
MASNSFFASLNAAPAAGAVRVVAPAPDGADADSAAPATPTSNAAAATLAAPLAHFEPARRCIMIRP